MIADTIQLSSWEGIAGEVSPDQRAFPTVVRRDLSSTPAVEEQIHSSWQSLLEVCPTLRWGQVTLEGQPVAEPVPSTAVSVEIYALGLELSSKVQAKTRELPKAVEEAFVRLRDELERRTGILRGFRYAHC